MRVCCVVLQLFLLSLRGDINSCAQCCSRCRTAISNLRRLVCWSPPLTQLAVHADAGQMAAHALDNACSCACSAS